MSELEGLPAVVMDAMDEANSNPEHQYAMDAEAGFLENIESIEGDMDRLADVDAFLMEQESITKSNKIELATNEVDKPEPIDLERFKEEQEDDLEISALDFDRE